MASSSSHHLLLTISLLFGLLAIGVNARPGVHFHPCKTLFISSFTITSFKPNLQIPENPNSVSSNNQNPSRLIAFFSEFRDFPKQQADLFVDLDRRPDFVSDSEFKFIRTIPFRSSDNPEIRRPPVSRFRSFGVSSIRERTEDILSVVVALLFGVGCGALTSATMYLAWSLITNRYEVREFEDDNGDFDDVESPKKMGYVKISADVPAPAKEVV